MGIKFNKICVVRNLYELSNNQVGYGAIKHLNHQ